MPVAKLKLLREISSEDGMHTAANIIQPQPGKKWKTKTIGEKSAHIIIELEQPQQIIGCDIGNEHSAFVEVMVSKSGCTPTDFSDLLVTCSFMTPYESKNSININRVRCFGKDALVNDTLKEKWKLIKVICTQPFNKFVQYGLSFLTVHVATQQDEIPTRTSTLEDQDKMSVASKEQEQNVNFKQILLRKDSTDSDSDHSCTLFNRWKNRSQNEAGNQTVAACIRNSARRIETLTNFSRLANDNTMSVQTILKGGVQNDNGEMPYLNQKSEEYTENNKNTITKPPEEIKESKIKKVAKFKENKNIKNSSPNITLLTKNKKVDYKKYRPFNQLLKGVVLVISGIQNPERGILRTKALAMGAKYRPDWDANCTHLICAFKNTPKFNQVVGRGKIVSPKWIEICYEQKKYVPWRRFALETIEAAKLESDEEIFEEIQPFINLEPLKDTSKNELSSSTDTDEEIQRVKNQSVKPIKNIKKDINTSIFDGTTDEEEYIAKKFKKTC